MPCGELVWEMLPPPPPPTLFSIILSPKFLCCYRIYKPVRICLLWRYFDDCRGTRKASFYVFTRNDQMWNQRKLWINRGYITFEWVLKIRKFLFTKTFTFTSKHRQPVGNPRIELKLLRITLNCWGDVGWTVRIHILAIVWPTPFLKLHFLPLNHIL